MNKYHFLLFFIYLSTKLYILKIYIYNNYYQDIKLIYSNLYIYFIYSCRHCKKAVPEIELLADNLKS